MTNQNKRPLHSGRRSGRAGRHAGVSDNDREGDTGKYQIVVEPFNRLIGDKKTRLLKDIVTAFNDDFRITPEPDQDGNFWYYNSLFHVADRLGVEVKTIQRAKDGLLEIGLIETTQDKKTYGELHWRICDETYNAFAKFAKTLLDCRKTGGVYDREQWQLWASNNEDIVEQFKEYLPPEEKFVDVVAQENRARGVGQNVQGGLDKMSKGVGQNVLHKYIDNKFSKERIKDSLRTASVSGEFVNSGFNGEEDTDQIRTIRPKANKPRINAMTSPEFNKPKKEPKPCSPCRYVDYWNSLKAIYPALPRCIGPKSYRKAKEFFIAHRRRRAGTLEYKLNGEKLKLERLNCIPPGEAPTRTHEQMLAHIDRAALAYHPDYWPPDKKRLPKSLPDFLFNSYGDFGPRSVFLEKLANPPRPLVTPEGIMAKADETELEIMEVIKELYNQANGRNPEEELDLREVKSALAAARNIIKKHSEIPVTRVEIFAQHFANFKSFIDWWKRYAEDHLWEGMPVSAFDVRGDLWRKFVDFVSEDIGYHLFTGNLVN